MKVYRIFAMARSKQQPWFRDNAARIEYALDKQYTSANAACARLSELRNSVQWKNLRFHLEVVQ